MQEKYKDLVLKRCAFEDVGFNGSLENIVNDIMNALPNHQDRVYDGQLFVFYVYYASLILAVAVKYASLGCEFFYQELYGKVLIVLFVFVSTFALLWSATLPKLLRSIAESRL